MEHFLTVAGTHLLACPSFLEKKKTDFLTLTICFISATRDIYTKLLIFSESPVKIEVSSARTFFVILLTSAVICKQRFWMETKLCNIFKTTNTITVTETVIKSTYKVLDSSWKRITLKRPKQFWKAVLFSATFIV